MSRDGEYGLGFIGILQVLKCTCLVNEVFFPVDPSVTNRPIRFKLTARTDNPKYLANSQVIPNLRLNANKQKVIIIIVSSKCRPCRWYTVVFML